MQPLFESRRTKSLLMIVSAVLLFLCLSPVAAQQEAVISPALLEHLDTLESRVSQLRELDARVSITRIFPTRDEAMEIIIALAEEDLTDEVLFQETQFYRAFDFIDATVDLWEVYTILLADQVAGFYNPDTGEMHTLQLSGGTLGDKLPPVERMIYAHEYTHALQDQHFGLNPLLDSIEEPDALLAAMSVVEGDATLVMQEYMMALVLEEPNLVFQLMTAVLTLNVTVPEGTPPILEAELMMPYMDGMEFITVVRDRGGWDAVNAAFANLPVSTEQVLHPEKYFAGEMPQIVTLSPDTPPEGAPEGAPEDGWELLFERTLGEFYLREYLGTQLGNRAAQRAAAGWGGDRYRLYYNTNADEHAWILRLAWDTPTDAADFVSAYTDFAQLRMGAPAETIDDTGLHCWQDAETAEALCLLDDGDTFVAYAPDWEIAAAMIANEQ